jgi:hypothetical protein
MLVICAVLVLVGFFVGMALAAIKIEHTLEEHSWMLQKKRLARDYRVFDSSKASGEEPDIEMGGTGPEVSGSAEATPENSNPTCEAKPKLAPLKDLGLAE